MTRVHGITWVVGLALIAAVAAARIPRPATDAATPAADPDEVRERDIRFYQRRVAGDRYGARDRAALAGLYLDRARARGSSTDLPRAEQLARESFGLRRARNGEAVSVLVGALMAEHRFGEAWRVAAPLAAAEPTALHQATLGEIALELGRYQEADSLFSRASLQRTRPEVAPRYARWLELNGRSGEARALLEATRDELAAGFRVPPAQLAWFDLRIGDLARRNGRPDLAEAALRRGLALRPQDARLRTALARLRLAQGRFEAARRLGEEALETSFDPATLIVLSEASAALGDTASAEAFGRGLAVAVSGQTGSLHRGWALFLLDHGQRVATVLRQTLDELADRHDVYGYDLAAWALFRSGRPAEALALADSALRRGTRDALLHYHAGRIAAAAGDSGRAAREAAEVRAIDPWFRTPAE